MLFITALDHEAQHQEFGCGLTSLEENLDFVNRIITEGYTLVTACLVENTSRTDLPVAAFDGVPMTPVLKALQDEWQTILTEPSSLPSVHQNELKAITRRRLDAYQLNIRGHQQMIGYLEQWLQRTQDRMLSEPRKSRLLQQYRHRLAVHQEQLTQTHFLFSLAQSRLCQMEA